MNRNPLLPYWDAFLKALNVEELSFDELKDGNWETSTFGEGEDSKVITYCRMNHLLRPRFRDIGLDHDHRLHHHECDLLCETAPNGEQVPRVAVSGGFRTDSSTQELRSLCCLATPLKVLLTCAEWCDDPGYWSHGGMKNTLLSEWRQVIVAHNGLAPQPHIVGVLVGEIKGSTFRLYSLALGPNGEEISPHHILIQRSVKRIRLGRAKPQKSKGPGSN